MKPDHFYRLETLVGFEIERFAKTLKKLRASHFPSAVAIQLIDELRSALENQQAMLDRIVADYADDPEGAGNRLKSEHRKLLGKLEFLQAIENARTDEVPWSIIPSVERLARVLIPDREILTTGTAEFNYAILWNDARSPAGQSRFFLLYLPKVHRANAFLHLLIAHELFHPLLSTFFQQQIPSVLPSLRDGCLKILKNRGEEDDLFAPSRLDQLVELVLTVWRRAMEEVMCDLGCSAIFGPAALLSTSFFAFSQNLDEPPSPEGSFYPPWRFRLRAILKYSLDSKAGAKSISQLRDALIEAGLGEDWGRLHEKIDSIRELTAVQRDTTAIDRNPYVKLAYEFVNSSLAPAWQFIESLSLKLDERWTEMIEQVSALRNSLESLVPPGEFRASSKNILGFPAALTAIAIAGWLYQLRDEVPTESAERLTKFRRTCRLILKAFEDSELKRSFSTFQLQ